MKKPEVLDRHEIIFACCNAKEALDFTGGFDKEKISFIRNVKNKVRALKAYDDWKVANEK